MAKEETVTVPKQEFEALVKRVDELANRESAPAVGIDPHGKTYVSSAVVRSAGDKNLGVIREDGANAL